MARDVATKTLDAMRVGLVRLARIAVAHERKAGSDSVAVGAWTYTPSCGEGEDDTVDVPGGVLFAVATELEAAWSAPLPRTPRTVAQECLLSIQAAAGLSTEVKWLCSLAGDGIEKLDKLAS
jgi:hypothetical protein